MLWTPDRLDTAAWIDFGTPATVSTSEEGLIDAVADRTGNGMTFGASGTERPTLIAEVLNGMSAASFNGTTNVLTGNAATLDIARNTGALSIFATIVMTGGSATTRGVFAASTPSSAQSTRARLTCTDTHTNAGGRRLDTNAFESHSVTPAGVLIGAELDYAGAQLRVSSNGAGSFRSGGFLTPGLTSDTASAAVRIGASGSVSPLTQQYGGLIGEIVVVRAILSEDDRQRLEGYLAHRWGFESVLPLEHPYYDEPPTIFFDAVIAPTLDGATAEIIAKHIPRNYITVAPTLDGAMAAIEAAHVPPIYASISPTLEGASAAFMGASVLHAHASLPSPVGVPNARALRAPNGLLHYWPLNEAVGPVQDIVNGFVGGGGDPTAGWIDGGRRVESSASTVLLPTSEPLNLTYALTSWTLSCAFYLDVSDTVTPSFWPEVLSHGWMDGAPTIYAYMSRFDPEEMWVEFYDEDGGWQDYLPITSGDSLRNRWNLLTLTCDGTVTRGYLNGVLIGEINIANPLYPQFGDAFALGGSAQWGSYFHGAFDEVAIWGRALHPAEVVGLWNNGNGRPANAWPLEMEWDARVALPSPIGHARVLAQIDLSPALGDAVTYYAMELVGGNTPVRVPISSWQATLQLGRMNYVQCVVPAAAEYVEAIGTRSEFVIYRGARLPSGLPVETEMARAPIQAATLQQGPFRMTCLLSGYSPGFASEDGEAVTERVMTGMLAVSVDAGGNRRVRADIDWVLRPGMRAVVGDQSFVAAYINYYVSSSQAYMDVGERAL